MISIAKALFAEIPLLQIFFLPDLTQVYFLPPAIAVAPTFVQTPPAFAVALAWIRGKDRKRENIDKNEITLLRTR